MLAFALLIGCARPRVGPTDASDAPVEVAVPLSTVSDLTPTLWRGITNIFLDSVTGPTRDSVRMPQAWTGAALDNLIASSDVRRICILRFYVDGDSTPRFAIDTAGDLDFTKARVLEFARQGTMLVANIELNVRSQDGNQRRVPYQILRSTDRYTYARIAEYRTGMLNVDGQAFAVRVRNGSRGRPFFAANTGTSFLIDMNADGEFAEAAALTVNGRPLAAEQAVAFTPFELSGKFYEIVAIDSAGSMLRIRSSDRKVAVASNRVAPEIHAKTLAGDDFLLSRNRGKVVLISFWATDCIYSERIRSAANALASRFGANFVWVAMARDTSPADIAAHLRKSPINGVVTLPDSAAWATYNPAFATPRFIIVDEKGIVRFQAEAASAMSVVTAKLQELLGDTK